MVVLKVIGIYLLIGAWIGVFVVNMSNVVGKPTLRGAIDWCLRVLFVSVAWIILLPAYVKYEVLK